MYLFQCHALKPSQSLLRIHQNWKRHICAWAQSCLTLWDPPPTVAPTGLLCAWRFPKAIILDWVAMPSSRGSSRPGDRTQAFYHCREILYHWSHQGSRKKRHGLQRSMHLCLQQLWRGGNFFFLYTFLNTAAFAHGCWVDGVWRPSVLAFFFFFSSWVSVQGTFDFSRSSMDGLGLGGFPGGRMWAGIQRVLGRGLQTAQAAQWGGLDFTAQETQRSVKPVGAAGHGARGLLVHLPWGAGGPGFQSALTSCFHGGQWA